VIRNEGWQRFNTWEHSAALRELYARRCRREEEELTAHRQTVRLLAPHVTAGDELLDVGCGAGYFYHSLRQRNMPVEYYGIDGAPALLEIGRRILPGYGLDPDRLIEMRIDDLVAEVDHVVCINVLSNLDNFNRPLERLLLSARKTVILRESIADVANYSYVEDRYLDQGVSMKVHVNTYRREDVREFIQSYGFDVAFEQDEYTQGDPQLVIDHPHWWTFAKATRQSGRI
jgi:cyclopropane fatty-acyl-phospholipid synthase-like methyltransferase